MKMRYPWMTLDREAVPVHTTEKIGPKQSRTPEGFLLCEDVPIARTGEMIYGRGQVPVEAGDDGLIRVTRDADTLFNPITLASFSGKPVTNEHPANGWVTPDTWKQESIGICLNPRAGEDENQDVIFADLLITDAAAIRDIEDRKREVSAGYEANYEQTGKGVGRQTSIIGNHIALVGRGRCGPRCAIGDHDESIINKEQSKMGTETKQPQQRRKPLPSALLRRMFADDLSAMGLPNDLMGEAQQVEETHAGGTTIHIHAGGAGAAGAVDPSTDSEGGGLGTEGEDPAAAAGPLETRIGKLETGQAQILALLQKMVPAGATKEAPPANDDASKEAKDEEKKDDGEKEEKKETTNDAATTDSAALETSFKQLMADTEILVPGFRFPTFDSKAKRAATVDTMCQVRRNALQHLHSTAAGKVFVDTVAGPAFDLGKATCADTADVFRAAVGAKRLLNNNAATADAGRAGVVSQTKGVVGVQSIADLNKLNREFHSRHTAVAK